MNEKLPAPCEPCSGSGMHHGNICGDCRGKGYRMFVNGNQISVRLESPKRWQGRHPIQRKQKPVY
jgi:hypothetical protein